MDFLTKPGIGERVLSDLQSAVDVRLAVAYFNPDKRMFKFLRGLGRLTLIISEEFTINDPGKLSSVSQFATVRSVPAETEKLHAKVLICRQADGEVRVLVGSANFTKHGLFHNREACISLDSCNETDQSTIKRIEDWFEALFKSARKPDLEKARHIFEARSLERRGTASTRYWALKTTSGFTREDYWQNFLEDGVVAIGWPEIALNPDGVSKSQLIHSLLKAYPQEIRNPKAAAFAATKLKKFVGLNEGDLVLICRGYAPNKEELVHIYGFGRITGPFEDDGPGC